MLTYSVWLYKLSFIRIQVLRGVIGRERRGREGYDKEKERQNSPSIGLKSR